jgi:hypothetical protein
MKVGFNSLHDKLDATEACWCLAAWLGSLGLSELAMA